MGLEEEGYSQDAFWHKIKNAAMFEKLALAPIILIWDGVSHYDHICFDYLPNDVHLRF